LTTRPSWRCATWLPMALSRWVLPRPELLYMNNGLYTAPGVSDTARAAATASRLAEPTTKLSKRSLASINMGSPGGSRAGAQALQHGLGDSARGLEHAGAMQRIRRKLRHAPEVDRVGQVLRAEDELSRQVLFVVLDDERDRARVDRMLGEIRVQILEA